jgi:tetratricopeptide (TPR) repeat protein
MVMKQELDRVLFLISLWVATIKSNNAVGFFDINKVSEGVALKLLNEIYEYNLENLNYEKINHPGIDLGDKTNKIGFQITSQKDSRKIEKNLRTFVKISLKDYSNGIRFLILNQEKKPRLKKEKYKNIYPGFDHEQHILTANDLIKEIRRKYDTDMESFLCIKEILENGLGKIEVYSKDKKIHATYKISIAKLPSTSSELYGREKELEMMDSFWEDLETNIFCLVAWGGVGKTALVNFWLNQLKKNQFRGAHCVFGWSFYSQGALESKQVSADLFISRALKWFGDPNPNEGSPWDKGERLAELINKQRTLLILDGLEPLQYPPGDREGQLKDPGLQSLLRTLAISNSGLCIITTRQKVDDIKGLVGVRQIELDNLSPEAGAYFLKNLGVNATNHELKITSIEFGGHALALTLLGCLLKDAYKGDIRYRKEIGPLEDEARHGGHTKRILEAYERWFGKGPEVEFLFLLGLFDRPAEDKAIKTLRQTPVIHGLTDNLSNLSFLDINQILSKLRRVRLLNQNDAGQSDVLDTHPLIREHFGEKLKMINPIAWKEANRRLYEYYKSQAPELPDNMEDMAYLYAAVNHGCQSGQHQKTFDEVIVPRIQRGKSFFSSYRLGAFGADLAALYVFFISPPPWDRFVSGLREDAKGYLCKEVGYCLRSYGRLVDAISPIKKALEIYSSLKIWEDAAAAAGILSRIYLAIGNLSESLAYAKESINKADLSNDSINQIRKRTILADVLHHMGRLQEAMTIFKKAEEEQTKIEPQFPLLYAMQGYYYNDLLLRMGKLDEVKVRAKKTLDWEKQKKLVVYFALDQLAIGRAYLIECQLVNKKQISKAKEFLEKAVDGLRQAGYQEYLCQGLIFRSQLYRVQKKYEKAKWDLNEAMIIIKRAEMQLYEIDCHLEYARLNFALGDEIKAPKHLNIIKEKIGHTGCHRFDKDVLELENHLKQKDLFSTV